MRVLRIDCDECVAHETDLCRDCLVTFLCSDADDAEPPHRRGVIIDLDERRAVQAMARVGLVPALRYRGRSSSVRSSPGRLDRTPGGAHPAAGSV